MFTCNSISVIINSTKEVIKMFLLATDYDGTLYTDSNNLKINIKHINKFMNNGNKFMIVTGRSFSSIKKEINKYNIKYDYLSCNNGLITFDNKDKVINSSIMDLEDLNYIYSLLENSLKIRDIKLYNFYGESYSFRDILEVYAKFKWDTSSKQFKQYIESNLPNIKCYKIFNKLFISNNYTKADAVSFIQHLHNIKKEDVYTVGDNSNDIEMLREFNGNKMFFSYPCLWLEKIPATKEVHTLVKKIHKGRSK